MLPSKEFMDAAIDAAVKARDAGDYGVGAVIVKDNKIIACEGNKAVIDADPTQHAEVAAIRKAVKIIGSRFLEGCVLYTTHEPCPMCASAAIWARMTGIVFGASLRDMIDYRIKNGTKKRTWRTIDITAKEVLEKGDPKLLLVEDFMRDECRNLFHQ